MRLPQSCSVDAFDALLEPSSPLFGMGIRFTHENSIKYHARFHTAFPTRPLSY